MSFLRTITRVLPAAAALALTSCLDCREEYWLHADGSARADLTYQLPARAAALYGGETGVRKRIGKFLADIPQITTSEVEVATEGERLRVRVRASFKDLRGARRPVMDSLPSTASPLAGEVSAGIRGRTLEYERTIHAGRAVPGAAWIPASQLEGHALTYILHLPEAALESNATRTENTGRTLVWEFPLNEALRGPVSTSFRMNIPIPWKLVSGVAVPLSLAGGLLIIGLRRMRRAS